MTESLPLSAYYNAQRMMFQYLEHAYTSPVLAPASEHSKYT